MPVAGTWLTAARPSRRGGDSGVRVGPALAGGKGRGARLTLGCRRVRLESLVGARARPAASARRTQTRQCSLDRGRATDVASPAGPRSPRARVAAASVLTRRYRRGRRGPREPGDDAAPGPAKTGEQTRSNLKGRSLPPSPTRTPLAPGLTVRGGWRHRRGRECRGGTRSFNFSCVLLVIADIIGRRGPGRQGPSRPPARRGPGQRCSLKRQKGLGFRWRHGSTSFLRVTGSLRLVPSRSADSERKLLRD